jgi:hypothetical protein
MNVIAKKVTAIQGVSAQVTDAPRPEQLSNRSPSVSITWDPAKFNITGQEVARIFDTTEPRIMIGAGGGGGGRRGGGAGPAAGAPASTGVSVTAFNLGPGEDRRRSAVRGADGKAAAASARRGAGCARR